MKWILKIWHDIYYYFASKRLEKAALTCQQAVHQIELSGDRSGMQLSLHLSLCQSCRNYHQFSKSFRDQLKSNPMRVSSVLAPNSSLEDLSLKLMKQFSNLDVEKKPVINRPH